MSQEIVPVVSKRGRRRIHAKSVPYVSVGKQGVPLRSQSRELVCRVRDFFQQEKINKGPLIPVEKVVDRTAAALKINKNTVVEIGKEKKLCEENNGILKTPNKKITKTKRVTGLDAFQTNAIRCHVYAYFQRKEYPTVKKLHVSLAESDLFHGSKSSLNTVLKRLGFKYKTFGKRKCIMERGDIVAWRCKFLRQVKDTNFDQIIWLDETWVNAGHCPKQGWTDDSVEGTMSVPIGKGGRIILLHAGSSEGFLPNTLLLFASKKTNEYHEEMDHKVFRKWFEQSLIPDLTRQSIIIMDNAKYHSKMVDKAPVTSSKKEFIIEWLKKHNIPFQNDMLKSELLQLVRINKPEPRYEIDEIANKHGHRVIRLPPYHCHFNCIELIWAQVKGYVARNNKKFSISEIQQLTKEAVKNITQSDWKKSVDHTKKIIVEAWQQEGLLENAVEELIININNNENSSSSEEDWASENESDGQSDALSGVFPLSPIEERVLEFDEF